MLLILFCFNERAIIIERGPILPMNISIKTINFPIHDNWGVIPKERPTVFIAADTSNIIWSRVASSVVDNITTENRDIKKVKQIRAVAFLTKLLGILLSKISMSSLPLNTLIRLSIGIITVVVLSPPPVDVGEAPIYIKIINIIELAIVKEGTFILLNPALFGVTAKNKLAMTFWAKFKLPMVSGLLYSKIKKQSVPKIKSTDVDKRTILVLRDSFFRLFFLWISNRVRNPIEPVSTSSIMVIFNI